jgi:hypothetical protein
MRRTALAAALLVPLLGTPAAADPAPTPTPTVQEPEDPLAVSVTDLLPRAPQAGQAFEVQGAIRNRARRTTVTDVKVRLARGDVITYRGALHDAERDGADMTQSFTSRSLTSQPHGKGEVVTSLDPGQMAYFDISTDVDSLGLRRTGVYPFRVEGRGAVDAGGVDTLGQVPTWIPFFSERPVQNKVAVVWPVAEPPHQAPDSSFVDDDLAASVRSGRLQDLLTTAEYVAKDPICDLGARRNDRVQDPQTTRCQPVPMSFAVEPDLVSAVDYMANADHYSYGPDHRRGTGKAAAARWLGHLKDLVARPTGSYLALPYGDPDVDALATTAAGQVDIANATSLGRTVLNAEFGARPVDAVYPPTQGSGALTLDAAQALAVPQSGDAFAFVLQPSAFPDFEDTGRSHSLDAPVLITRSRAPRGYYGLVADDDLSALVLGPSRGEEGDRLAEQRFIAETAIIAAELPGTSRTFLLAPYRYSGVSPVAAADALRDLGRLPWLCPVSLEAAAQRLEGCPTPTTRGEGEHVDPDDHDPRTELRQTGDALLPATYLRGPGGVAQQARLATQLTTQVLDDSDDESRDRIAGLRLQLQQAVYRAESAAWRQDADGQAAQLRRLGGAVASVRNKVQVLGGKLLLTSSKGTIQVSVQNSLDLPVQVRVKFAFPGGREVESGLVSVAPKRSVPVGVKAEGLRSGKFPVVVRMYDRENHEFQGAAQVVVTSTRYGRLALGVTFAAAAVLFFAAGARLVRRALRKAPRAAE